MKSIQFFLLAFLIVGSCHAAEDHRIADIRTEYKLIRADLPKMSMKEVELDDYSTDGGSGKIYTLNGHIRFIRADFYGESGKSFNEYYYKDNRLFFVLTQDYHYNVPYYVTAKVAKNAGGVAFDPKKTKVKENRYYFYDGRLIRWINDKHVSVNVFTKKALKNEKDMVSFESEIRSKLTKALKGNGGK